MSKESSMIYRLEHLDKYREYQKEYHKKYNKIYKAKNKEKCKEYEKKRRKKLQINNKVLNELEEWLKEQGNNGIDEWGNHYTVCLYKIQKLKEKYK